MPSSVYPLTTPKASRSVKVASGYVSVPVDRELRRGDLGIRLPHRLLHVLLVRLAHGARWRIDQPGQLDHRIGRFGDRLRAAGRQPLPLGDVLELRAVDQFGGAIARRFAGQHFDDQLVVGAQLRDERRERIGQIERFQIVVDRSGGIEPLLERRPARFGELGQPLAVRLGVLRRHANQRAGQAKQPAVEALLGFQHVQVGVNLLPCRQGSLHIVPGCLIGLRFGNVGIAFQLCQLLAKRFLLPPLSVHRRRILQAGQLAPLGLARVSAPSSSFEPSASVLLAPRAEGA